MVTVHGFSCKTDAFAVGVGVLCRTMADASTRESPNCRRLMALIEQLHATYGKRITEVEAKLAKLSKNSSTSSKPSSSDIVKPKKPKAGRGKRRIGGQQGRSIFEFLHSALHAHLTGQPAPSLLPI